MVEITLKEISAQNNKNIREQEKQTGFLKSFVEGMRLSNKLAQAEYKDVQKKAASDRLEKEEKRREAKVQKAADRMNSTFGERFKNLTTSISKMNEGMNKFKLPGFLKKILFGAAVLTALKLIYQNWDTIKETWTKMKPKLIELKDTITEFVANLKWDDIKTVVTILASAWVVTKLFIATNVVLSTMKLFLGGIRRVTGILSAAWLLLPGTGRGRGGGPKGALGRLKGVAKKFGLRVVAFTPLLATLGSTLWASAGLIAKGMGFSGIGAASVAGAVFAGGLYLAGAALVGIFKTVIDTSKELNNAKDNAERAEIWSKVGTKLNMNITNAIVWPIQWAIAKTMEMKGADPGKVAAVKGFNVGEYMFDHKPGTFSFAMGQYMTRGIDWFMGRHRGNSSDVEDTFGFKAKFAMFTHDLGEIPSRLKDTAQAAMERMQRNFKDGWGGLMFWMGQIPARMELFIKSAGGTGKTSWLGGYSKAEYNMGIYKLDQLAAMNTSQRAMMHAYKQYGSLRHSGAKDDARNAARREELLLQETLDGSRKISGGYSTPGYFTGTFSKGGNLDNWRGTMRDQGNMYPTEKMLLTQTVILEQIRDVLAMKEASRVEIKNYSHDAEFGEMNGSTSRGLNMWDGL